MEGEGGWTDASLRVELAQIEKGEAPRAPKSTHASLRGAAMTGLQRNWTSLTVREQFDSLLFRNEYMRRFVRASGDVNSRPNT